MITKKVEKTCTITTRIEVPLGELVQMIREKFAIPPAVFIDVDDTGAAASWTEIVPPEEIVR